jgi:hypothetical protein
MRAEHYEGLARVLKDRRPSVGTLYTAVRLVCDDDEDLLAEVSRTTGVKISARTDEDERIIERLLGPSFVPRAGKRERASEFLNGDLPLTYYAKWICAALALVGMVAFIWRARERGSRSARHPSTVPPPPVNARRGYVVLVALAASNWEGIAEAMAEPTERLAAALGEHRFWWCGPREEAERHTPPTSAGRPSSEELVLIRAEIESADDLAGVRLQAALAERLREEGVSVSRCEEVGVIDSTATFESLGFRRRG